MADDQVLTEMFLKAARALELQPGVLDAARRQNPVLAKEIERTLEALDRVWRQAVAGQTTEKDFRSALTDWYRVHKKAGILGTSLKKAACQGQQTHL